MINPNLTLGLLRMDDRTARLRYLPYQRNCRARNVENMDDLTAFFRSFIIIFSMDCCLFGKNYRRPHDKNMGKSMVVKIFPNKLKPIH